MFWSTIRSNKSWAASAVILEPINPNLFESLYTWVSTGIAGIPNEKHKTITPSKVIKSLIPILRESAQRKNSTRQSSAIVIEASGVDPSQLKSYKGTGVDCISTSASVTRSKWIDLSMRFENKRI